MEVPQHLSPEIVTIDTPANINTHKAADATENESCHDANSGPNPPANPAEYGHSQKNAKPVHFFILTLDKRANFPQMV